MKDEETPGYPAGVAGMFDRRCGARNDVSFKMD